MVNTISKKDLKEKINLLIEDTKKSEEEIIYTHFSYYIDLDEFEDSVDELVKYMNKVDSSLYTEIFNLRDIYLKVKEKNMKEDRCYSVEFVHAYVSDFKESLEEYLKNGGNK